MYKQTRRYSESKCHGGPIRSYTRDESELKKYYYTLLVVCLEFGVTILFQKALNANSGHLMASMTLSSEMIVVGKRISPTESSISLIIPVFNQASKISYSLEKIKQAVESTFSTYELIVVNDGSTDNTLTSLKDIAITDEHIHVISYTPNRGKGYAVKQGVLHSHGDAVILLDGDLDISPDLIKDYVERLSTSDLVIASKKHPESSVRIPRSRAFLSRAFNLLTKLTIGISQTDTQAGFKVGKGDVMRTIFRNISVNRYAFDVEVLAIASIMHLKVQEMPVIMKIDRRFKMKEVLRMFIDLIRIAYNYRIAHRYQHIHHDTQKEEVKKEVSNSIVA